MNGISVVPDQGVLEIHESIRRFESTGRAFIYSVMGGRDVEVEAEAGWIRTKSKQRYLDWGSFSVYLLGHRHPRVVAAVAEQLARLPGSTRAFPHEPTVWFHREMARAVPPAISKFMLLNSGAEATEAALKLARAKTGRPTVFYLEKAYHGKTMGALAVTDAKVFRAPFEGLLRDTVRISRLDASQAATEIRNRPPAAVILEAIQGEGGIFELGSDFLQAVRAACTEAGSLLICDEIQCGLGRSGETWAFEKAGIVPDIVLAGKALGGGIVPASAVLATPAAFTPFDRDPLLHSSTFGGNPLAASAAAASLNVLREQQLARTCAEIGRQIGEFLTALRQRRPDCLHGVSGRGLLRGLHFSTAAAAGTFLKNARREQLLLTPCLTTPTVLRLTPPATTTPEDLAFAFQALERACD